MRIGIVTSQFGNITRGGAEVQMEKTMQYLNEIDGVEAELIDYNTHDLTQYDIVHFFKSNPEFAYLIRVLKEKRVPYVVSSVYFPLRYQYEVLLFKWLPRLLPRFMNNWMLRTSILDLWNQAEMIFPNTDDEEQFLKDAGVVAPMQIIPNGLDPAEMQYVEPKFFLDKFPQLKGEQFVLNVGRIDRRKNQKRLVEACMALNIPLVVIGAVWEQDYYEEILKLGYDKVHFLGPIFDKKLLYGAFAACEVFCLPSTLETPGIVALEAAFYNKPIVITSSGGTKYYFKDQAKYVNWQSTEDIKSGIAYYYCKSEHYPKGLQELISNYYWDAIAKQYVMLYQRIISKYEAREANRSNPAK